MNNTYFQFDDDPYIFLFFLKSWSLISTPINIFGCFVILKGAPKTMDEYKWHLFTYQFCSLSAEFILTVLIRANLFFPIVAGKAYGLYKYMFEQPGFASLLTAVVSLVCCGCSIVQCFAYRHRCLLSDSSVYKISPFLFHSLIVSVYVFAVVPIVVGITISDLFIDLEDCIKKAIEEYPHTVYLLENVENVYFLDKHSAHFAYFFYLIFFYLAFTGVCLVSFTTSSFYILNAKRSMMSAKSRAMQMLYMKTLLLQVGLPFISLGIPILYLLCLLDHSLLFPQPLSNLVWSLIHCHAVATTFSLLFLKPLRDYVTGFFGVSSVRRKFVLEFFLGPRPDQYH